MKWFCEVDTEWRRRRPAPVTLADGRRTSLGGRCTRGDDVVEKVAGPMSDPLVAPIQNTSSSSFLVAFLLFLCFVVCFFLFALLRWLGEWVLGFPLSTLVRFHYSTTKNKVFLPYRNLLILYSIFRQRSLVARPRFDFCLNFAT